MKKILLTALAGICIMGVSVATSNRTGVRTASIRALTDTIPKDTSKLPEPDTTSPRFVFAGLHSKVSDTLPKDTTKRDTSLAYIRYSASLRDTIPQDTTKPDTSRLVAFAK